MNSSTQLETIDRRGERSKQTQARNRNKEERGEEVRIDSSTQLETKEKRGQDQARNQKQRAVWLERNR